MEHDDTYSIIEQARLCRAREIRHLQGLLWARTRLLAGKSLAAGIAAISELIRTLSTWNARARWHS